MRLTRKREPGPEVPGIVSELWLGLLPMSACAVAHADSNPTFYRYLLAAVLADSCTQTGTLVLVQRYCVVVSVPEIYC